MSEFLLEHKLLCGSLAWLLLLLVYYVAVWFFVGKDPTSEDVVWPSQEPPGVPLAAVNYIARFGKQGRGYNVKRLLEELHQILGITREWSMVLVGVGQLGRAILGYGGFAPQGFRIVGAYDVDPTTVGERVNGLEVKSIDSLPEEMPNIKAQLGIVAVPAASAQKVIDMLVECGVKAILNYAPIAAQVPSGVRVKDIDPVLALQSMTFYIKESDAAP